jgi:ribose transport system permease protein
MKKHSKKKGKNRVTGPLLAVLILAIILTFITDYKFITIANITNIMRQTSINALVSMGMLLVLLTGGIDLSVGSIVGFSACIMATMYKSGIESSGLLIAVSLLVGTIAGGINGILFTKLKLPHPFVSTLGMMEALRGLVMIISDSMPVNNFPKAVSYLGGARIGGRFPISFILVILVVVFFDVFLERTALGRKIYVVGGNLESARLSGIDVDWVRNFVYMVSGFMAALAGIVLVGRVNSFFPTAGNGYEMDAIAACVIGGASFLGGEGTAVGALVGALFITIIKNGLNLLGANSNVQQVVVGLVIILAVYLDVKRTTMAAKRKLFEMEKAI